MLAIKNKLISIIYDIIYPLFYEIVYIRDKNLMHEAYGKPLRLKDRKSLDIAFDRSVASNVSGHVSPEMTYMLRNMDSSIKTVILDGEPTAIIDQLKNSLPNLKKSKMVTVGLGSEDEFQYKWNYEEDAPTGLPKVDLIVCQANLEHLLDPFKHVKDLSALLDRKGHMLVQTHVPGYSYHRYPIDALRFYPDWFEETADRCGMVVVEKYQYLFNIYYHFQKI